MKDVFEFYMPTHVLMGYGQLSNLHQQTLPGKKALIVTSNGKSTKVNGYLADVEHELDQAGVQHILFDHVRPNPTNHNVMDGAKLAHEQDCDFVVALGGGSVMDCGKFIALMMTNSGDIMDYSMSAQGGHQTPQHPAAPIVAITTSAGTGSEVDNGGVVSDDESQEKTAIGFPSLFPTIAVVDARLMMSVPKNYTVYQGMDTFLQAAESMVNTQNNPMGEMFALKVIELVAKYLPRAYRNGQDREARENMALANTLGGYYMYCTSEHTMEHTMGSFHPDLVHGAGLIMICRSYFKFFADRKAAEEPMMKMAKAMGVEHPTSGQNFIKALDDLLKSLDADNLKMSDAGITKEELKKYPAKIHEVIGGDIHADPLPLSDEDYLAIYEDAYK